MLSLLRAVNIDGASRWSKSGICFSFFVEIRIGNLASPKFELLCDCGQLMIAEKNEAENQEAAP